MDESWVWQQRAAAELETADPGLHLRVHTVRTGIVEGSLIHARRIMTGGLVAAVQVSIRSQIAGRVQLTLARTDTVEVFGPPPLQPHVDREDGDVAATQLRQVDELLAGLYSLTLIGDEIRGFQTPAMARVIGVLEGIRRGAPDPLAGLPVAAEGRAVH